MSENNIAAIARYVEEGHVIAYDNGKIQLSTKTKAIDGEVCLVFPNGEHIELQNTLKEDIQVFMKIESWVKN